MAEQGEVDVSRDSKEWAILALEKGKFSTFSPYARDIKPNVRMPTEHMSARRKLTP